MPEHSKEIGRKSGLAASAARALLVVVTAALAHTTLRAAAAGIAKGEDFGSILLRTAALVAACLGLSLAIRLYRSRPLPVPGALSAILLVLFGSAYLLQIQAAKEPGVPLPSLGALAAEGTITEGHPGRPPVVYQFNRHGVRGPDWEIEPSGPRLCLIGDSYVFGSGVEWRDSLGQQLSRRLPDFEMLNLGVMGHNLESHITMYGYAAGRLECNRIVLALVLPNDLSRWDINSEIVLKSTVSMYSLVGFVFGPELPARIWNTAELSHEIGPDEREVLREQWQRLAKKRSYLGDTPLLVFAYVAAHVLDDLPHLEGVAVLPNAQHDPSHYIPNDGHPNARGNTFFAERIAAAISGERVNLKGKKKRRP